MDFKEKKYICEEVKNLKEEFLIDIYNTIKDIDNIKIINSSNQMLINLKQIPNEYLLKIKEIIIKSKEIEYEIENNEQKRKKIEDKFRENLINKNTKTMKDIDEIEIKPIQDRINDKIKKFYIENLKKENSETEE